MDRYRHRAGCERRRQRSPVHLGGPDFQQFQATFDVPEVLFAAFPFVADPQVLIDRFQLNAGCETFDVQPDQDPVFTGVVQVGSNCGPAGTATWNMVVANPADQALTALVQVQTATAADQAAFDMVLGTFDVVGAGTIGPHGSLPTVPTVPTVPASTLVLDPGATPPRATCRSSTTPAPSR